MSTYICGTENCAHTAIGRRRPYRCFRLNKCCLVVSLSLKLMVYSTDVCRDSVPGVWDGYCPGASVSLMQVLFGKLL